LTIVEDARLCKVTSGKLEGDREEEFADKKRVHAALGQRIVIFPAELVSLA
jgi:hypothetical protein